jgi:dihydroflavonol-4-reductase
MSDHLNRRLPGTVGPERVWSFAFADDVADAHVAALTVGEPARDYIVGGVNAPQQAIFEFLRDWRQRPMPRRIPYAIAWAAGAAQELVSAITRRPPLITRGAVEIFRHDWPLKSDEAVRDLGLRITPLADGLAASLAAL